MLKGSAWKTTGITALPFMVSWSHALRPQAGVFSTLAAATASYSSRQRSFFHPAPRTGVRWRSEH